MTSLIETISTVRHLWVDVQHAARVASWLDQFLAQKFPQTAPIPMASTGLGTVAVVGAGTSALVGYGAGKAANCFFQHVNPNYVAIAAALIYAVVVLKTLSNWATVQFRHFTQLYQLATQDKTPYFIEKRGPSLELDRSSFKHTIPEQLHDFLYRRLYVTYGIVGSGQEPVQSLADLQDRLEQSVDLLDRHLPKEAKKLFNFFNAQTQADFIENAKIELQSDLRVFLNLAPSPVETPLFIQKRGAPLRIDASKAMAPAPDYPLSWYQGLYREIPAIPDFLFRRLYAMYEIVGNGRQVQSYPELKDRLAKATELLDRHLSQGLTEDERIVLFERLTEESRAGLIKEAKIALLIDLRPQLNLTSTYEEIVRRATIKERIAVELKLDSLPKAEETIQNLLSAIEKGDWDDEIFKNNDFSYYALEAVRRGQLSQNDYATVQIFWEITQMHPDASSRKMIAIFNADGTVNKDAKDLILTTLKYDKNIERNISLLPADQIDQLFEKIKKLPKIQQHIWIVPHVREPIVEALFTPVLAEVSDKSMMVAPLGLMQAFLDTAFGENAVKINPVHGLSSWNDIRQGHLDGTRDYAIHSPLIELPEKADGNKARWFYFGKHDFYHALLISSVPVAYRKYFVECYDTMQRLLKKADPDIGSGIIDMEVLHFFDNFCFKKESLNDVFWVQLADLINATAMNEQVYEALKDPNFKQPTPEQQSQYRVVAARQQMVYAEQLVSHLRPIPEIQEGAHAVLQKVKENKFSYRFGQLKILEALAEIEWLVW